jgi:UDPglucose 6-dehydrogenase
MLNALAHYRIILIDMIEFGIVGYGIVGKATHRGLLNNCEIKIHDIKLDTQLSDLSNVKYAFFCIPTFDDETVNTLIDEIHSLKKINPECLVIVRCTVPVGTCQFIEELIQDSIIYIPEFLRDRCWEEDCLARPLIVGNDTAVLPEWLSAETIVQCSNVEAEVLKMFSNNFAATRTVLANHFYDLSRTVGADYNTVLDCYSQVAHKQSYLEANETLRGFGGKCLSKDLDFIIETFATLGLDQTYFNSIREDNKKWPVTVRTS